MKYMRITFTLILVTVFSLSLWGAEPQDMPTVKKQVAPVYPELLKKAGIEGQVWLKATVDENGKVVSVTTEKTTNKDFDPAAIDAVKQWEFNPGMKDGKPIKVSVMIPFKFKLDKDNKLEKDDLLNLLEDNIKDLLKGKVSETLKNQVAKEAHIVLGNRDELLSLVLSEQSKRKLIVEGSDSKVESSRMVLNDAKDSAFLEMKTSSSKTKGSRFHTIVFMKSSEGEWKIQAWHMST